MPEGLDTFLALLQALAPAAGSAAQLAGVPGAGLVGSGVGTAIGLGRSAAQRRAIQELFSSQGRLGGAVQRGALQGAARAGLRGPAAQAVGSQALGRFQSLTAGPQVQALLQLMQGQQGQIRQGSQDLISQLALLLRQRNAGGSLGAGAPGTAGAGSFFGGGLPNILG